MKMQTYIVHYGELALKGRNRRSFEDRLIHNIHMALRNLVPVTVKRFHSYILVDVEETKPLALVEQRLARIPGIAYVAPALRVAPEMEQISDAAMQLAREVVTPELTFKVDVRRGDKRFPLTSVEIGRILGAQIVAEIDAPVKLKSPDVAVCVQIYEKGAYVFARRIQGLGGLPVGTGGKVLTLLSGGIDSPVAAHMLLKRGCKMDFLHFHVLPDREPLETSKVVKLARKIMEPHQLPTHIYMAPAHPFQMALLTVNSRYELVLFRRFVMRTAVEVARRCGALALVTGDSLGQVASQTLKNLGVIAAAVERPVLRPLVGFDKSEIIALAKDIDTYELSIAPYKDPCALHARHPATWARLEAVEDLESGLDLDSVMQETLEQMREFRLDWKKEECV